MKLNAKTISLFLITAVILVIVATRIDFSKAEEGPVASAAPAAPTKTYVKAYVVTPTALENRLTSKGTIIPNEEVEITSEVSGKIIEIFFNEGDRISKGDLLISLDDSELQAQLQKSEYELQFLETKAEREQKLNERGGISDEEYEATVRDLNTTKAQIELIKAQIDKTKIRAPFSGTIGLRYVSEGSYVSPSTQIANLVDASRVKLDFTVPEKYMSVLKKGTKITFTMDGIAQSFEGSVYAIEPKIDPKTRTITLRANCPNQEGLIIPGAFANIQLLLDRIENALSVPTEAIIPEMESKKVYLVKEGKAESAQVETGLRLPKKVQVVEGLQVGDTVIISGILQVRNGTPVSITEVSDTIE